MYLGNDCLFRSAHTGARNSALIRGEGEIKRKSFYSLLSPLCPTHERLQGSDSSVTYVPISEPICKRLMAHRANARLIRAYSALLQVGKSV